MQSSLLASLTSPSTVIPIPFVEISSEEIPSGTIDANSRLILIQTGANLGFAGRNNVGLRFALPQTIVILPGCISHVCADRFSGDHPGRARFAEQICGRKVLNHRF
jgi:hypothetical protein